MNKSTPQIMSNSPQDTNHIEKYGFLIRNTVIVKDNFSPLHWHDYFECEIILSGSATHVCNNDTYTLQAGDAYILSPADIHSLMPECDMRIFNVKFNHRFLPADITKMIDNRSCNCRFSDEETNYIHCRANIIDSLDSNSVFYQHMAKSLLTEILLMIIQKSGLPDYTTVSSLVQRTTSYVLSNFRERITLASAARQLNVTPKYLGAVFRKNTNMYFNDYINNTRLKYACNLLIKTDLSVKEIAYSSGYGSVEYFLEVFKKKIKMTPTQYRNATEH